ncbi:MAG: thiol-disulfide oxidoreductase DCC family protein [Chloroflexota bacterium]
MDRTTEVDIQKLPQPLILFDGVCNLCSASVQFIIENDAHNRFHFASLQSPVGQGILKQFGFSLDQFDSVLLLDDGELFSHSTAACKIAEQLSTPWRMAGKFTLLPQAVRDFGYGIIAKNRYRIWGKNKHCWLPTPELSSRFL